jgi:2-polyprenyl-6-methoxyphenol hydroxylase-like FAD-dependent oxidoreductase
LEEKTPVLIVGGSLVGLTASALLGRHGVPHIMIERHRGTAIHPRAAAFHQRTLEIFRNAGIEAEVEQAAEREFVQNGAIMAVESLGGRELAWFYRDVNDGVEDLSPSRRIFITQIGLEPVLRARAIELGADLRYGVEMTGFTQDGEGVLATVRSRDGGEERRIRARYMIAADGAHSPVRRALGLRMTGRGDFSQCFTIYFRADVRALLRERNLSVVYVNQPGLLAFFRFSITADAGFLAVFSTPESKANPSAEPDLSEARCVSLVRKALGVAEDFPVAIENVQPWTASAATAGALRSGNVFLAGDAAHVMPPTGGFGGNTGVADAHNLAWKLAMVLDGRADPALLDSYEAERRPIGHLTVEQAYRRYVERVDPTLPSGDLEPNLADTAIELGAIYRSDAIVADGSDTGERVEAPEQPSGRPGTRLAHLWLQADDQSLSTLDLAGDDLVLLAGPDGQAWMAAGRKAGVEARTIDDGGLLAAAGLGSDGAAILRPDGVIGWRSKGSASDPDTALAEALDRLHGRAAPRS